jgi:transglutaminase-like putative cysteine protease
MKYRIVHKSTYEYRSPVSFGNHVAWLQPRSYPHHVCMRHELEVAPKPAGLDRRVDFFGNTICIFTIDEPHDELEIVARSEVALDEMPSVWPEASPPWERVTEILRTARDPDILDAWQFVFESPRIQPGPEFGAYAAPSFRSGRPLTEAVVDLTARIHKEFHFDAKSTSVRTSADDVLAQRSGVCQDFAHIEVACLRSLGLAARYVSGYVRTSPPPGKPRLVGADASHAWVSVFCPGAGWLDIDPTHNMIPSQSHVTLAWGRDYGDLSPVRGVIVGGRDHELHVAVDMTPVEQEPTENDTKLPIANA